MILTKNDEGVNNFCLLKLGSTQLSDVILIEVNVS